MRLKKLIEHTPDLEVKGSKEVEVTGLCANSTLVAPGNLFIAKKGRTHDGTHFIPDAVASGATCVLTDMFDPFLHVTQLIHPHVAEIEAKLAAKYYHDPSFELKMIGVTGTNGKTTTSYLIKHMLDKAHLLTGLIGTIEWIVGDHHLPGSLTTPGVITNHKLLREMVGAKCGAAVMEATSHGLDQNRLGEIDFDVALFTNLSPEHLDYHHDMEQYRLAKEKLFQGLSEDKWAIFNADDKAIFTTRAKMFTFGIHKPADLMAKQVQLSDKKIQFLACFQGKECLCKSPLIGEFNVYNLLAAIAVGLCSGLTLEECVSYMKSIKGVPGRLEKVKNGRGLNIFVDFAHTEDALANVLKTLSSVKQGKLITVFGCGRDR
ncbi:MAG: UDP-N-acetylmuramoyl-L-alanyl-D-glutamate--2,6-diaminopimelate ligase, partial [Chlamydiae bacterium]|nr:UDP-N-acetylmuramoyl-L-alanyl-D-glutamate--2,6-diaminopimelate ligase [Chlamydiota bacterium]